MISTEEVIAALTARVEALEAAEEKRAKSATEGMRRAVAQRKVNKVKREKMTRDVMKGAMDKHLYVSSTSGRYMVRPIARDARLILRAKNSTWSFGMPSVERYVADILKENNGLWPGDEECSP